MPNNFSKMKWRVPPTKNAIDLMLKMLDYDPSNRITASDALEHPYFQEIPKPSMKYEAEPRSTFDVRQLLIVVWVVRIVASATLLCAVRLTSIKQQTRRFHTRSERKLNRNQVLHSIMQLQVLQALLHPCHRLQLEGKEVCDRHTHLHLCCTIAQLTTLSVSLPITL
jgi:serine/threonine protein kinase